MKTDLFSVVHPVIEEWMETDYNGAIYAKELTDLVVEALMRNTVALYNAGYKAGRKAFADEVYSLMESS